MQTVLFTFSTSLLLFYTEGMENDENAKHILLLKKLALFVSPRICSSGGKLSSL